jgi:hypothetical protein
VAMGHDPQQKHAQIRDLSKLLQTREETHSGNNNKSINDVMDAIDGGVQVVHSDLDPKGLTKGKQNRFFGVNLEENDIVEDAWQECRGDQVCSDDELFDLLTNGLDKVYLIGGKIIGDAPVTALMDGPVFVSGDFDAQTEREIREALNAEKDTRVTHDMDWHQKMSDALADYSDEELYFYDTLKKELEDTLDQRAQYMFTVRRNMYHNTKEPLVPQAQEPYMPWERIFEVMGDNNPIDHVIDPDRTVTDMFDGREIARPSDGAAVLGSGIINGSRFGPGIRSNTIPLGLGAGNMQENSIEMPKDTKSALVGAFYLDRKIAGLLKKGLQLGCYEVSNNGKRPNPCDWSPKRFYDALHLDISHIREARYQQCIRDTAGYAFDQLKKNDFPEDKKIDFSCGVDHEYLYGNLLDLGFNPSNREKEDQQLKDLQAKARAGNVTVDGIKVSKKLVEPIETVNSRTNPWEYFTRSQRHYAQLRQLGELQCALLAKASKARQKELIARTGEIEKVGSPDVKTEKKGNDKVNLYYEFDHSFGLMDCAADKENEFSVKKILKGETEIGHLGAQAKGGFEAGVNLFGNKYQMVGGYAEAKVTPSQSTQLSIYGELTIADKNVFSKGWEDAKRKFEQAKESFEKAENKADFKGPDFERKGNETRGTIFEASTRFQVGPIPMSINVGLTGKMGIHFKPNIFAEFDTSDLEDFDKAVSVMRGLHRNQSVRLHIDVGMTATPYLSLDAFAQLCIDLVVAKAGVEAEMTIIDLSFPMTAGAVLDGEIFLHAPKNGVVKISLSDLHLGIHSDLKAETQLLNGQVNAFAKLDIGFFEKTFRKKLFGWPGLKNDWTIYELNPPAWKVGEEIILAEFRIDED